MGKTQAPPRGRSRAGHVTGPALLTALVLLLLSAIASDLRAQDAFSLQCDDGEVLAGVRGKTGHLWFRLVIEEVEPLCADIDFDLTWQDGEPEPSGETASPGPGTPSS